MQFSRYDAEPFGPGYKNGSFEPSGDGEIRTLDPLLARQVLSQLSYTPNCSIGDQQASAVNSIYISKSPHGLKWTRTTDLTLIRRAL